MNTPDPAVGKIREDIEHTRRELGDTAEALAHKVDVPARAKEKAAEVKESVKAKAEQAERAVDNLPEPAAQRVRGVIAAVKKRPGAFLAGVLVSITIVRRVARRKNKTT